ncbi:MAG: enoyl-CoA hydratase-related protein [Solirubrobacteraceae bacterium]|nr:enoyl-CoA hydratase-related protein [Solirubrobacteraceae bacterium]
MELREISLAVTDGVATVTLDRPGHLNAFTHRMGAELVAVLDRTDADDDVRAVVFTGRGRAFCAGADLGGGGEILRHGDGEPFDERRHMDYGGTLSRRLWESTKPLIAAVNGPAVGVGASSTLPMDVRICSTDARFGFVFARRGLVPEAASSWFLPRIVGISRALEWVVSGRVLGADEALEAGLVRSVHAPDDLLPAAHALARDMTARSSPVAVAVARRMLWGMLAAPSPDVAHRLDSEAILEMGRGADVAEGIDAFLAKRDPEFPSRVSSDLPEFFRRWREETDLRVPPGRTLGEPPLP